MSLSIDISTRDGSYVVFMQLEGVVDENELVVTGENDTIRVKAVHKEMSAALHPDGVPEINKRALFYNKTAVLRGMQT